MSHAKGSDLADERHEPTQHVANPPKMCLIYRSNKAPYCGKCFNCTPPSSETSKLPSIEQILINFLKEDDDGAVNLKATQAALYNTLEAALPEKREEPEPINARTPDGIADTNYNMAIDQMRETVARLCGVTK